MQQHLLLHFPTARYTAFDGPTFLTLYITLSLMLFYHLCLYTMNSINILETLRVTYQTCPLSRIKKCRKQSKMLLYYTFYQSTLHSMAFSSWDDECKSIYFGIF